MQPGHEWSGARYIKPYKSSGPFHFIGNNNNKRKLTTRATSVRIRTGFAFVHFLSTSGRACVEDERRQEMNSCGRQGWTASTCINWAPLLLPLSPISSQHSKFSSKLSGRKMLTWQRQTWAGKPIYGGANAKIKVRCKASNVGEGEFEEKVLKSDVPVLVDFVADWCGPCKLVAPFIDWASQEYKDKLKVFKIDHDSNPQLVEKYRVYGLPTLILFKDGQEVSGSRREGAITKEKLKVYLDRLLESVTAI